jgi:hypothetical protein
MLHFFGPNSTGSRAVGGPEIKLLLQSHADRPDPLQLLDGYGQHFLLLPVDAWVRVQARIQAQHVYPCAIADREKPTGPANRRQKKAILLPVKSPLLRLRLVVHWIKQLNSHWFVGGPVMVVPL